MSVPVGARALALSALACACLALPASALAVPTNDNYENAYRLNNPGTTLPRDLSYTWDNNGTTTQTNEILSCGSVSYSSTAWWEFHPDRPGIIYVTASAGFQLSLSAWRFTTDSLYEGECNTASSATLVANFQFPTLTPTQQAPRLQEGQGYKLQISGVGGAQGSYAIRFQFDPDSDRDGFVDSQDDCDDAGGVNAEKHNGCADTDGDNFLDKNETCDTLYGTDYGGCPDGDGDGVPEGGADRCPNSNGYQASEHNGCPDNDRDGLAEGAGQADDCPSVNPDRVRRADRNKDGCPDRLRIKTSTRQNVAGAAGGAILKSFSLRGVPKGAKVTVTCKLRSGRKCGGLKVKSARKTTLAIKNVTGKLLPFKTKITARISAAYATSRYIRFTIVNTSSRVKCQAGTSPRKLKRCG